MFLFFLTLMSEHEAGLLITKCFLLLIIRLYFKASKVHFRPSPSLSFRPVRNLAT